MFKKRTLSPQEIKQAERVRKAKDTLLEFQAPEGLFQKCNCCGKLVYKEDLIENDYVCPVCGNYFRIRPKTRIAMVLDKDTFEEWDLIELFPASTDLFNISVHLPLFVKDNDVLTYFQSDTNCNGILVVLGINHLDIFELAEFAQKILVLSYIKQKGHADLLNDFLNSYF